jgi:hypothetical protein
MNRKDSPPRNGIPGGPSPEPPTVEEPTEPRQPLPLKPDQTGPATVSPTGQETGAEQADLAQGGAYLTTAQGARLPDTDHSLKAGSRGPVLLQDHHLREKITHFDHERIPEPARPRAVGAPGHGRIEPGAVPDRADLAPGRPDHRHRRRRRLRPRRRPLRAAGRVRRGHGAARRRAVRRDAGRRRGAGDRQRTFATARSIEFDAVLLAGAPGPAADAAGALDAKAGDPATGGGADPRVLLMLSEAYRHGKAVGGWAGADSVLTAAGVPTDAPGVVTGDSGDDTLAGITRLLGGHRVWERFA